MWPVTVDASVRAVPDLSGVSRSATVACQVPGNAVPSVTEPHPFLQLFVRSSLTLIMSVIESWIVKNNFLTIFRRERSVGALVSCVGKL